VWSGRDAKARGLVDQLGGLLEAVRAAKVKGGIDENDDDYQLVISHAPGSMLGSLIGVTAPEALLEAPVPSPTPLPKALEPVVKQLGPSSWLFGPPAIQARLEYDLELR
jgi:protease-4